MLSTVATAQTGIPRAAQRLLRGLGRLSYRLGRHASVAYAVEQLGRDLSIAERKLVLAGWAAERDDAFAGVGL